MAMNIPQATMGAATGGPLQAPGVGSGGGGTAAPAAGVGAAPTTVTDKYPSGSWNFGPISIDWSIKDNDELDVKVSILGVDIDDLSGTLKTGDATFTNQVNVLGLVKGSLTLEARWDQPGDVNGLWIFGQVSAVGWNSGQMNHRIISW